MRTTVSILAATAVIFIAFQTIAGDNHDHKHEKEAIEKVSPAPARLIVCQKCGELKGSEKCCKVDAQKCPKCGLNKGSIGCCRDLKPAKSEKEVYTCSMHPQIKTSKPGKCPLCKMKLTLAEGEKEVVLCAKCGQVKGSENCCKIGAEKCEKCGLAKGSPGCCKLPQASAAEGKPQTKCPLMGGKINKKHYADYEGKRIYFCCPGCKAPFKKNPEKYIKKLEAEGIVLEDAPEE